VWALRVSQTHLNVKRCSSSKVILTKASEKEFPLWWKRYISKFETGLQDTFIANFIGFIGENLESGGKFKKCIILKNQNCQ